MIAPDRLPLAAVHISVTLGWPAVVSLGTLVVGIALPPLVPVSGE